MLSRALTRFALFAFGTYGVLWTIIESFSSYFPSLKPEGWFGYACSIVVSCSIGLWRAWPPRSLKLKIPKSDSSIRVEFGDLFKRTDCIAIQVNEFFDSLLGDHVSPNSLHGQFIRDILAGQSVAFDALVSNALADESNEEVARKTGNRKRYRIGTTATVDVNNRRYFLFAFTKTDVTTLKASATVHELWDALAGLWSAVRLRCNGNPVSVGLVGGGLSGVGLPPGNLLQIMMISYLYYTKKNKITGQLTIVLPSNLRGELDLSAISEQWSNT